MSISRLRSLASLSSNGAFTARRKTRKSHGGTIWSTTEAARTLPLLAPEYARRPQRRLIASGKRELYEECRICRPAYLPAAESSKRLSIDITMTPLVRVTFGRDWYI